ncbi:MAG: NUDIX domain-containing protein [Planctomycetota bacterium]|nr:NUDIX domain-containing protein [Planctomycetota bacterium]
MKKKKKSPAKQKSGEKKKLGKLRRAAGVICYRQADNSILILRHSRGGHWGIPKGHRDPEDPDDLTCALRELEEEAGFGDVTLIEGYEEELHYTVPATKKRKEHPKIVVHFLALWPKSATVTLSHEHDGQHFLKESELDEFIEFDNMKPILQNAFDFMKSRS